MYGGGRPRKKKMCGGTSKIFFLSVPPEDFNEIALIYPHQPSQPTSSMKFTMTTSKYLPTHETACRMSLQKDSQIAWIFKFNANVSYCLYDSGPMVRHYALGYGFHGFPNLLTLGYLCEIPREVKGQAFVYKTKLCASLRGFSTNLGTYGSHSHGQCRSIGPNTVYRQVIAFG